MYAARGNFEVTMRSFSFHSEILRVPTPLRDNQYLSTWIRFQARVRHSWKSTLLNARPNSRASNVPPPAIP